MADESHVVTEMRKLLTEMAANEESQLVLDKLEKQRQFYKSLLGLKEEKESDKKVHGSGEPVAKRAKQMGDGAQ